jgi:hypothetical protein
MGFGSCCSLFATALSVGFLDPIGALPLMSLLLAPLDDNCFCKVEPAAFTGCAVFLDIFSIGGCFFIAVSLACFADLLALDGASGWGWGATGTGVLLVEAVGVSFPCSGCVGLGVCSFSKAAINRLRKSSFEISGPMYSFSVPFLEQSQQTKTELPTGIQRLNALDKNNSRELRDRAERGQESSFL